MNTFFHIAFAVFRGVVIGLKSVTLFYIADNLEYLCPNVPFFSKWEIIIILLFGLTNGVLNALIILIKNAAKHKFIYKIVSCVVGIISTVFIFLFSLYMGLPDTLVDHFVYGEGGGGLEPGGWFGFTFMALIYFTVSLFVCFFTIMILSNVSEKEKYH
jgi:hypothetical protein